MKRNLGTSTWALVVPAALFFVAVVMYLPNCSSSQDQTQKDSTAKAGDPSKDAKTGSDSRCPCTSHFDPRHNDCVGVVECEEVRPAWVSECPPGKFCGIAEARDNLSEARKQAILSALYNLSLTYGVKVSASSFFERMNENEILQQQIQVEVEGVTVKARKISDYHERIRKPNSFDYRLSDFYNVWVLLEKAE